MSRILEVLKNKNRIERMRRIRQKEEIGNIKDEANFRALLSEDIHMLDLLFEGVDVESVEVEIEDKYLTKFNGAIYTNELSRYEIEQVGGSYNRFYIRRRILDF